MAFESIVVGSGSIFLGPVGEAFPDTDAVPGGNWVDLGEFDGGVTANFDQTIDQHFIDSESGPVKATRSQEQLTIAVSLAEATMENLAKVLDDAGFSNDAGPPATRTVSGYRGLDVQEFALLFRGESPYGAFNAQFQVPRAYQSGTIGAAYTKESKTLIPAEFTALVDPLAATDAEKFGSVVAQTS